jgi:hypothetical protein
MDRAINLVETLFQYDNRTGFPPLLDVIVKILTRYENAFGA